MYNKTIEFSKYQGTGNDFVIIDNRSGNIVLDVQDVKYLCDRRFGIGADGLILLNTREGFDFDMQYYNADGKESTMCGNGGRCLVKFAYDQGVRKSAYHFFAVDGGHEAFIEDNNGHSWVNLKMKDVTGVETLSGDAILNTGSPHYVKYVTDIRQYPVVEDGRNIRYNELFFKKGINVNFVERLERGIFVRTYERGVEDETLSCGTGVTASALVSAHNENGFNRVDVLTMGGSLAVEFNKTGEESFDNIWLCGPATLVFQGNVELKVKN